MKKIAEVVEVYKSGECYDCKQDIVVTRIATKFIDDKDRQYIREDLENRGSVVKLLGTYILVCKKCFDEKYSKNYKFI